MPSTLTLHRMNMRLPIHDGIVRSAPPMHRPSMVGLSSEFKNTLTKLPSLLQNQVFTSGTQPSISDLHAYNYLLQVPGLIDVSDCR
jgi:hypothetical protein